MSSLRRELPLKDGKTPVLSGSDERRDGGFESVASLAERIARGDSAAARALGDLIGTRLTGERQRAVDDHER